MKPYIALLLSLFLFLCPIIAKPIKLVGKHYDADTNELLYVERIKINMVNKIRTGDRHTFHYPLDRFLPTLKP